jgi:enediyne core biosynthesis thioesterase
MKYFEYRHRVGFEETNLVGNVYFTHYLSWQGRCREMFLCQHSPELLEEISHGLALVTARVACTYYRELTAFDEVAIRMHAAAIASGRLTMVYQYFRLGLEGDEELVAEGEQEVVCMRRFENRTEPVPLPPGLREAVELYMSPA